MALFGHTVLVADFFDGTLTALLDQLSLGLRLVSPASHTSVAKAAQLHNPLCCIWYTPGYSTAAEVGFHHTRIRAPYLAHVFVTIRPWTDDSGHIWGLLWPPKEHVVLQHNLSGLALIDSIYRSISHYQPNP